MTIEVKLSEEQLEELARRVAAKVAAARPPELPAMLTTAEAAKIARVCRATLRARIVDGTLPASRTGRDWRIRLDDLERFMRGRDAA
ncbi:MAG: helix-turn-helix domain-containing protein [Sandaracinus sp.]|nr:helix-turn-helix domain-containing protein [Myxococcales bacterium]MCB9601266.1 helix-turn-helix domain-containing protein [Sandaracinus sp.]